MASHKFIVKEKYIAIGKDKKLPKPAVDDAEMSTDNIEMWGPKGSRQGVTMRRRIMGVNRKNMTRVPSPAGVVYVAPYTKMVNGKVVHVAGYYYQRKAKS